METGPVIRRLLAPILALSFVVGCPAAKQGAPPDPAAAAQTASGEEAPKAPRCIDLFIEARRNPAASAVRAAAERCKQQESEGSASAAYLLSLLVHENSALTGYGSVNEHLERAAAAGHILAKSELALLLLLDKDRSQPPDARGLRMLHEAYCAHSPVADLEAAYESLGIAHPSCPPSPLEMLTGAWDGEIEIAPGTVPEWVGRRTPVRLVLSESAGQVFQKDNTGNWYEVKPGAFHLITLHSNFILASQTDGWDEDGQWVETLVYEGTMQDAQTLRVTLARTVNNLQLPRDHEHASFSHVATGMLRRAAAP
jgi:hypothetical protein